MASKPRFRFLINACALLLSIVASPAMAATEDELLEPDKAFALTTRMNGGTLEATWTIAPGYYMYRDKFRIAAEGSDVRVGAMNAPAGKKKEDPLFGVVETYTKSVTLRVPIERINPAATQATVKITGQGCNEPIGVCYPPINKVVAVALPAVAAAADKSAKPLKDIRSLRDLSRAIDGPATATEEPIDPELAFTLSARRTTPSALTVRFNILDCCYLYRNKVKFALSANDGSPAPKGVRLAPYTLPAGEVKHDEFVGKTEVYHNSVEVPLRIEGLEKTTTPLVLTAQYQGCAERGVAICYPPAKKYFSLSSTGSQLVVAPIASLGESSAATGSAPTTKGISAKGFVVAVVTAFGIGLLLTFTPCVLPMIPILSSVIVGSSDRHITKLEGGVLSIAYVLGTAVTYTAAGVLAGATGEQLQAYFQNPWALGTFAAILGVLALSMFGFYELQVPSFVQSHLHQHSSNVHSRFKHIKGGAFFGVFGMGLVSALIVGACVSPLLISALGVAIANRDPVLGGAIMFAMALGMGVVLIGIGFGAAFLLPKAGKWMESVKHVFGVLLLGVAIYLLGYLPQVPVLFLWAALLITTGVYMGATQSLPQGASGWLYFNKGLGTFLLVWGVLALLGGFAGNRDILNPFPFSLGNPGVGMTAPGTPATVSAPLFTAVRGVADLNAKLAAAKQAGKPALLDYFATWCTDCVRMEKSTFIDPAVQKLVRERFVALQVDVTDPNNPDAKAVKQQFGVFGPPAMLYFGSNGTERRELRTYGYKSAAEFLELLRKTDTPSG